MKPILLFGKDGQVGTELQKVLPAIAPLVAVGRNQCDLADLDAVRRVIRETGPGLIVNAAAYTAVDKAEQERDLAFAINAEAPRVMAEEARVLGVPLIHYSTDYVFDGEKTAPYVETDACNPQSVYGASKLAGEQAIAASGASAIIFRTSWVFGAAGGNFVKTILRLARERESLRVVADQYGCPTPAALIADVTVRAIRHFDASRWPAGCEIFHLASSEPVSWHQFAVAIVSVAREAGIPLKLAPEAIEPIPTEAYPLPAKRPKNSRLDCDRLARELSTPLPRWRDGMREVAFGESGTRAWIG